MLQCVVGVGGPHGPFHLPPALLRQLGAVRRPSGRSAFPFTRPADPLFPPSHPVGTARGRLTRGAPCTPQASLRRLRWPPGTPPVATGDLATIPAPCLSPPGRHRDGPDTAGESTGRNKIPYLRCQTPLIQCAATSGHTQQMSRIPCDHPPRRTWLNEMAAPEWMIGWPSLQVSAPRIGPVEPSYSPPRRCWQEKRPPRPPVVRDDMLCCSLERRCMLTLP